MANTRVDQHVEKGNDDGLYISSVACCQVRPGLAGSGREGGRKLLPGGWQEGGVTGRAAGSARHSGLRDWRADAAARLALTCDMQPVEPGLTWRCAVQVYNLSQHFLPKEWIMEKWEEGYYITAMAGEQRRAAA